MRNSRINNFLRLGLKQRMAAGPLISFLEAQIDILYILQSIHLKLLQTPCGKLLKLLLGGRSLVLQVINLKKLNKNKQCQNLKSWR